MKTVKGQKSEEEVEEQLSRRYELMKKKLKALRKKE